MNGTNKTKVLLIDYQETSRKKTLIVYLKRGFFKSFSGQNNVNSNFKMSEMVMISRDRFPYSNA